MGHAPHLYLWQTALNTIHAGWWNPNPDPNTWTLTILTPPGTPPRTLTPTTTTHTIRGVNPGTHITAQLTNTNPNIPPSNIAEIHTTWPAPNREGLRSGRTLPILNLSHQTLILRLGGLDTLLRVLYQPSDKRWYADIEIPVNIPYTTRQRLTVNTPILDPLAAETFNLNLWCRPVDDTSQEDPQTPEPWNSTHLLAIEET